MAPVHTITNVNQLLSLFQTYQVVVIMVNHEAPDRQSPGFIAEQRKARNDFFELADKTMSQKIPVGFAIHDLHTHGDRGEIQEYCKTASVPYVAVCKDSGVVKHWPKFEESKITRTMLQSISVSNYRRN